MKFALAFERASNVLTTFAHDVYASAEAAQQELTRIHEICFERGSGLSSLYSVQTVVAEDAGVLLTADGRQVKVLPA